MLRLHHIDEAPDGSSGSGGPDWMFEDNRLTLEEARDEPTAPGGDWYYGTGEDAGSLAVALPWAGAREQGTILDMLAEVVPGDQRRMQAAYGNFPQPVAVRPVLRRPPCLARSSAARSPAARSGFGWVGAAPRRPRPGGWTSIVAYGSLALILVAALGLAVFAGVHSGVGPGPGTGPQTATVEIAGEIARDGIRP